jgi:hypothetical protein
MATRAASAVLDALVGALLIAACSPLAAEQPTQEPFCLQGTVRAILQIDTDDPRVIWASNADTGNVFELRLPGGYGVNEHDQLVDADGRVIGESGDMIVSGCADIIEDALEISEADIRRAPEE